ncbi:putative short-chain dehydrogenase [Xylariaceae sp. FL0804]|nr:putative short-chain dehydrogenase [Xylariaceae sp. FL0804]
MSSAKGTILITGANGGLGVAMVRNIVSRPELAAYHGLYAVRDASTATGLQSTLNDVSADPHTHDILSLDLTQLSDVRKVAATINARVAAGEVPPIRALILNAGYLEFFHQTWTSDGFDTSFAATYLGHWLLTLLLLQSMDRDRGRVVLMGSASHDTQDVRNNAAGQYLEKKWHTIFHDSTEPIAKGRWSTTKEDPSYHGGFRRYGASKLCQVMMIPELQRRIDRDPVLENIAVLGIDPGSTPTGIFRRGDWRITGLWTYIMPWLVVVLTWLWPNGTYRTTKKSAGDIMRAAFDSDAVLGEQPKGRAVHSGPDPRDPRTHRHPWVLFGNPRVPTGLVKKSSGTRGYPWVLLGNLWVPTGFVKKSSETRKYLWVLFGNLWVPTGPIKKKNYKYL